MAAGRGGDTYDAYLGDDMNLLGPYCREFIEFLLGGGKRHAWGETCKVYCSWLGPSTDPAAIVDVRKSELRAMEAFARYRVFSAAAEEEKSMDWFLRNEDPLRQPRVVETELVRDLDGDLLPEGEDFIRTHMEDFGECFNIMGNGRALWRNGAGSFCISIERPKSGFLSSWKIIESPTGLKQVAVDDILRSIAQSLGVRVGRACAAPHCNVESDADLQFSHVCTNLRCCGATCASCSPAEEDSCHLCDALMRPSWFSKTELVGSGNGVRRGPQDETFTVEAYTDNTVKGGLMMYFCRDNPAGPTFVFHVMLDKAGGFPYPVYTGGSPQITVYINSFIMDVLARLAGRLFPWTFCDSCDQCETKEKDLFECPCVSMSHDTKICVDCAGEGEAPTCRTPGCGRTMFVYS